MLNKTEFSIAIDHHFKIIRYKHTGSIKKEDLDAAWSELIQIKEFTQLDYNLLSDYRESKFDIPLTSIDAILEDMKPMKPFLEGKKQSFIIDDPMSMAIAMLFMKDAFNKIGFKIESFSTEKAAVAWLLF